MSNAERLQLNELNQAIARAKSDLDHAEHGSLYNRAVVEKASAKLADLQRERNDLLDRFPGKTSTGQPR